MRMYRCCTRSSTTTSRRGSPPPRSRGGRGRRPRTRRTPPDRTDTSVAVFSVVHLADDELVDDAVLWGIDTHNRSAHVGMSLLPAFRGQGLGRDIRSRRSGWCRKASPGTRGDRPRAFAAPTTYRVSRGPNGRGVSGYRDLADEVMKGGAGALAVQRFQGGEIGGDEGDVVNEIAEDLTVSDEGQRVGPLFPSGGHQGILLPVDHVDRVPVLVDAFGVAGPAGDDRRGKGDGASSLEVVPDDGEEPFGDAVRALGAQPRDRIPHLRVGEPGDQVPLVVVQVDARHRFQRRCRLLVHVGEQERREERVLTGIVHEAITG